MQNQVAKLTVETLLVFHTPLESDRVVTWTTVCNVLNNYMLYLRSYRHIPLVKQISKLPDLVLCLLYELLTISFVEHIQVAGEATRVSHNFHAPNSRVQ